MMKHRGFTHSFTIVIIFVALVIGAVILNNIVLAFIAGMLLKHSCHIIKDITVRV